MKKQDKYNLVRWAVTGRDDLGVNTRCWRLTEGLRAATAASDDDWRELCYLWSSDFRTRITGHRWARYLKRLNAFSDLWLTQDGPRPAVTMAGLHAAAGQLPPKSPNRRSASSVLQVRSEGRFLDIRGERLQVRLNCLRGLALDAFIDPLVSDEPLCGTLQHGYFDDIRWGADYDSGHLVCETPGRHKVTDLNAVEPQVVPVEGGLRVSALVQTPLGPIEKVWWIDEAGGRLVLSLRLHWLEPVLGSLRLGHVTLIPGTFDPATLRYRTHNGGTELESFALAGQEVNHGRAVSFLVSANQALGVTGGVVELGDARRRLQLRFDKTQAALIGLVSHHDIQSAHFTRLALSARKLDDTSRPAPVGPLAVELELMGVRAGY